MKTIKVTQEHINKGKSCSASTCPVALAVGEAVAIKKDESITVNGLAIKYWDITGNNNWFSVEPPDSVCEFMTAFDHNLPVEPFEFELDIKY